MKPNSSLNKEMSVVMERRPENVHRKLHRYIHVSFGSGFCINELQTGFDSNGLNIGILPDISDVQILELLKPFGQVTGILRPLNSKIMKAYFEKSSEAFTAMTALHGKEFLGHTLEIHMKGCSSNRRVYCGNVARFEWDAPCLSVYMGYANRVLAQQAIDDAAVKPFGDFMTVANFYVGRPAVGTVTVKFQYLPFDVDQDKMKIFGPHQGMMTGKMNFANLTPQDMARGFRRVLSSMNTVDVGIRQPPYVDGKMVGWAVFSSAQDARLAAENLDGLAPKYMGGTTIKAFHVKSVSLSLSPEKYRQVRTEVGALQDKLFRENKGYWLTVSDKETFVNVRMSGDDVKVLGGLKAEFEKILNGETLYDEGKTVWDPFFERANGREFLYALAREFPGVTVETIPSRRSIRLFGIVEQRAIVRSRIVRKAKEQRARMTHTIRLRPDVATAYSKKSDGFSALEAELGVGNVILNVWENKLVVLGDMDIYTTASDAVFAFQQKYRLIRHHRLNGDSCPACFGLTAFPIKLPCGHAWCRSCLQRYLKFATESEVSFPLVCHGIDKACGECIPLFIARDLLSPDDLEAVFRSALSSHIRTHLDEFHYCPTPDCQQIHRSTPEGIFMQCPECLTQICTHCHSEAHNGLTCKEASDGDGLFQEWAAENKVKQCPKCKVAIEKAEGCNHVTCSMCQTHICWVCMQTFENGLCIYGHMEAEHGGSGV